MFRNELQILINKTSKENGSDTPDYVLANYLNGTLYLFDKAVKEREKHYGRIIDESKLDKTELTLEERFEWLKNNKPSSYKEQFGWTWEENVETNIKGDLYQFVFNHPYYGCNHGMTDDEARHNILDEIDVPRMI